MNELHLKEIPEELWFTVPSGTVLSERQIEGATAIAHFSLDDIANRLKAEANIPENLIPEAILEFRKFMTLILISSKDVAMTSKIVDEVWHTLILFTKQYAEFCYEAFGKFVHHVPNTGNNLDETGSIDHFKVQYRSHYGDLPKIWKDHVECGGTTNCQGEDENGETSPWDNILSLECNSTDLCDGAEYPCDPEFGGGGKFPQVSIEVFSI